MSSLTLLMGGVVVMLLLYLLAMVVMARRRGRGIWLLPLLRLLFVAFGGVLIWQAFWNLEEAPEADDQDASPLRLAILEDVSASMDFRLVDGRPRGAVAEEAIDAVRRTAEQLEPPAQVEHLIFADQLMPASDREQVRRGATQLNEGLATALGRLSADRLLIVSDGASTDGPVPAYLADWLRNRRVELFALIAADPNGQMLDWRLDRVQAAKVNPAQLVLDIALAGTTDQAAQLEVTINGEPIASRRLPPGEAPRQLTVPVPELEPGWHVYEATISAGDGEVTTANNRQIGVFRQTLPNRILLLYGAFRRENLHLADRLQTQFGERLSVMQVRDPALTDLPVDQYDLLIVSDLSWARTPAVLRQGITEGQLTCMLLTGDETDDWTTRALDGFPVSQYRRVLNFSEQVRQEGTVKVHRGNRQPNFFGLTLDRLQLNLVREARLPSQARTLFVAEAGNREVPLLVTDSVAAPRYLVMLADTTWKWALSPAGEVRQQERIFWSRSFSWLLGEADQGAPLRLTFEEDAEVAGRTDVQILPRDPSAMAFLSGIVLEITDSEGTREVTPQSIQNGFRYRYDHPRELPQVVWFHASGSYREERWESDRRPLALSTGGREWLQPLPQPQLLRAAVGQDGQAAYCDQVEDLLPRLFADPAAGTPPKLVRQRNQSRELLLGIVLALLLAVEWWFERWLKAHR